MWSGEARRSWCGAVRRGLFRLDTAVVVRFGLVGSGVVRRLRFGATWKGTVRLGVAVGARSGLVGFGELGHGGYG